MYRFTSICSCKKSQSFTVEIHERGWEVGLGLVVNEPVLSTGGVLGRLWGASSGFWWLLRSCCGSMWCSVGASATCLYPLGLRVLGCTCV